MKPNIHFSKSRRWN